MTKPVLADPRRTGTSDALGFSSSALGEGTAVEMPVLFQLADLSQFKVLTPPAKPKPGRHPSPPTTKIAEVKPPAAPESEPLAPAIDRPAANAMADASSNSTILPAGSAESASDVSAINSKPLLDSAVAAVESPAPPPSDSPTIRERAQMRQRRQAAAKGDWFQTQGKYIVVVFLFVLIGTIYLARRSDDSPPSPAVGADYSDLTVEKSSTAPPLEGSSAPSDTRSQFAGQSHDAINGDTSPAIAATAPSDDALVETSPAEAADAAAAAPFDPTRSAESAGTPPQVSLQTPIATTTEPPVEPNADEGLFPWAGRQQPRVATRPQPEAAHSSVPMPQPNPHYQPRPSAGGAAPSPPAPATTISPQETDPGSAVPAAPGEQPGPPAYPVTDPSTYRAFQSPTPRGAANGAVPASYENRVPTAPRPSGPRYERTGSGLY